MPKNASSTRSTQRPRSLDDPYAVPHQQSKAPTNAHKRFVRHTALLSRLQRTAPKSKVMKRRRPSKKLVAGLDDLEAALPDTSTDKKMRQGPTQTHGNQKQRSLKSRPGALQRKEKLLKAERERFAKNLALMATEPRNEIKEARSSGVTDDNDPDLAASIPNGARARWAAIRAHVGRTMEMVDRRNDSS